MAAPASTGSRRKWSRWGPWAALALAALFAFLLSQALRHYDLHEAARRMREIPAPRLALALACVALSYLFQAGYDFVALASLRADASAPRAALAAFVANALTNNVGFSLLTAVALRFRFYSAWGHGVAEIAHIVALSKLSYLSGLLAFTGAMLLTVPPALPFLGGLPPPAVRALGAALLLPGLAVLACHARLRGRRLRLGRFTFHVPPRSFLVLQTALACAHQAYAALTLLFLLPGGVFAQAESGLGVFAFISLFMAAKFASLFLPVPGSLGVLEGAAVAVFTPTMPVYPLLGALLAYRLCFYLLPLAVALALLAGFEILVRKRAHARRGARGNAGAAPANLLL